MAVLLDLACKPPRARVHMMERPLPDGVLNIGESVPWQSLQDI